MHVDRIATSGFANGYLEILVPNEHRVTSPVQSRIWRIGCNLPLLPLIYAKVRDPVCSSVVV